MKRLFRPIWGIANN